MAEFLQAVLDVGQLVFQLVVLGEVDAEFFGLFVHYYKVLSVFYVSQDVLLKHNFTTRLLHTQAILFQVSNSTILLKIEIR